MKITKKFAKKLLKSGIQLLIINQGVMGFLFPYVMSIYPPTRKTPASIVSEYKRKVPKEFNSLDYVNLSNMLVTTKGKGDGVCRDYAIETMTVYKQLTKENDRKDLENKIRLVSGKYDYTFKHPGHVWLEVYKDGEWVRYESTDFTPEMKIENIPQYSEMTLKQKQDLSGDDEKVIEMMKSLNGTRVLYPKLELFLNGGVVEFIYYRIKDI